MKSEIIDYQIDRSNKTRGNKLLNINNDVFYFINHDMQNPILNFLMPHLTDFGSFIFLFAICLIGLLISNKFKFKIKNLSLLCLKSLLLSGSIILIIKLAIHEPRPFITLSNVNLLINIHDPNSFPSGHSASIFAVTTILFSKSKRFTKHYKILNCFLVILACLIAISRIYIGVHYPFDVFIGSIIGIISGVVVLL